MDFRSNSLLALTGTRAVGHLVQRHDHFYIDSLRAAVARMHVNFSVITRKGDELRMVHKKPCPICQDKLKWFKGCGRIKFSNFLNIHCGNVTRARSDGNFALDSVLTHQPHSAQRAAYGVWEFFAGDCASSWSSLFLTNGKSCTSKKVI